MSMTKERRRIKRLLTKAEQRTEHQFQAHQKREGQCSSSCAALNHYWGRVELLRWLRQSLDERLKKVQSLNEVGE